MKRLLFLLFLVFVSLAGAADARLPKDGELTYAFVLEVEQGVPYLRATLRNQTQAFIEFELPAGLRFNGTHEPCLPVVLGQDVQFQLPPGQPVTLKIQALNLYLFAPTGGEYEVATFMDDNELDLSGKLQRIWDLHYRNQLAGDPFRYCQIAVYLANGVGVNELSSLFSAQEIAIAQRI